MARLIEVGDAAPAVLTVKVGDLLSFSASGGGVEDKGSVLRTLGPFSPAIVALNGEALAPETMPTTILVEALEPGAATVLLFSGSRFEPPQQRRVRITVEP